MSNSSKENIAVILFNLGGPDSKDAIKPFLFNFFMDPNIINLPLPFRWLIAKLISTKRSKNEAGSSYKELNYVSPLLKNTKDQASALQKLLNDSVDNKEYKTYISMRYWHPMADEVARKVKEYNPSKIVLLPLYPQFSTTTTWSSFGAWNKAVKENGLNNIQSDLICCYPDQSGYVKASADNILVKYNEMSKRCEKNGLNPPRLLFSAHGLPEKIIKSGDPYQSQCEKSAKAIVDSLNIGNLDWDICYQSSVGPMKWIKPSTEQALQKAAKDKVPVLIYPHAFVNEHVETLVEIEIEYRDLAKKLGIPAFERINTVGCHDEFIKGLADMVINNTNNNNCSVDFSKCCKRIMK